MLCFLLSLFITQALSWTSMGHSVLYRCDDSLIQLTEISSIKRLSHQWSVKRLEITVLTQMIQMNCQRSQSFRQINQFELYSVRRNRISWIHKLYTAQPSLSIHFTVVICGWEWWKDTPLVESCHGGVGKCHYISVMKFSLLSHKESHGRWNHWTCVKPTNILTIK